MVSRPTLNRSKAIQQRTGRTFHAATRLLPDRVRHATYVLYAFFRIADDVVDDPNPPPAADRLAALDRLRREALGTAPSDDPVLRAVADLRDRYGIPDREVDEFIAAMARDVDPGGYATRGELGAYLRGSSVAVANMMLAVMDPDDPDAARPHARSLGEAFQLTNFLRDVREDVLEYDRIYLPESTLERHGVPPDQVRRLEFTPGFAAAMREELERTEALYRHGVDGIALLPADVRFPVVLAAVLYADHHRLIRDRGFDVLAARPTLGLGRRLELTARTWWAYRGTRDPRAAFEAVTDFGDAGDHRGSRTGSVPGRGVAARLPSLDRALGGLQSILPGGASK